MARPIANLAAIMLIAGSAFAQPVIRTDLPVFNSASARYPGLPGSGIAQGSIFTILGTGLGPAQYVTIGSAPPSTKLGGTSVSVTVGGVSVDALLELASNYQINAILPSATPIGNGTITVTYNRQTSAPAPIQVVASAFGIFTGTYSGYGQAIATDANYGVNSVINAFHPGDYVTLWGTGLGAIQGDDAATPPVGNLPVAVTIHVGDTSAPVVYAGRSGCCAGMDQVIFQVPQSVAGCAVPVAVEVGGTVSNIPTIAVSATGATCSDSIMGQDLLDKLAGGATVRFGYLRLESEFAQYSGMAGLGGDSAFASFSEYTPQTAYRAVYGVSRGYCASGMVGSLGFSDQSPAQLDAGSPITVAGRITISLTKPYGTYVFYNAATRFLWSAWNYAITAPGGDDVGPFAVNDTTSVPSAAFTGLYPGGTVPRSGDLKVQWSGGDPAMQNGNVTIGAYSEAAPGAVYVFLQCTAPAGAGQFTIPGWVLSLLPPSGTGQSGTLSYPLGWMWIGQYNNPVAFQAQGLDRGIVSDAFFNGLAVSFQ